MLRRERQMFLREDRGDEPRGSLRVTETASRGACPHGFHFLLNRHFCDGRFAGAAGINPAAGPQG
jgi:hypothetical protein